MDLKELYFDWMYRLVIPEDEPESYRRLLYFLDSVDFSFLIERDGNRAEDGISLRYRFAYDQNISYPEVGTYLDDHPCSVLEMMVALALKCEEQFMADPDVGNRTSFWFMGMLQSLGLDGMDDMSFRKGQAKQIIDIFLLREYDSDGKGGLFYIEGCPNDLRQVEIWYQMCWYLDSILYL